MIYRIKKLRKRFSIGEIFDSALKETFDDFYRKRNEPNNTETKNRRMLKKT